MCVMSLLCGPWADLYLFMGCTVNRLNSFPSIMWRFTKVGNPSKAAQRIHRRKTAAYFAPMAPVASNSRLRNRRQFCFPFVIVLQDAFASRTNQRSPVWSHRQNLGLNSSSPLRDSNTAWDSNYSHSGWETVSCTCSFLSRVLMSTGARDCLQPRVQVIWVSGRVAISQR